MSSAASVFLRHLQPAMARVSLVDAVRAGAGACIGIGAAALVVLVSGLADYGVMMIAPFGATAVLLFAVPNSPLAQPWSAVAGNTLSAVAGLGAVALIPHPSLAMAAAVGLAIALMMLARALHPPGGAVALTVALSPDMVQSVGAWFPVVPVMAGTAFLAAVAVPYAYATGRRYPFRVAPDTNAHGTKDRPPSERLNVSRVELAGLLAEFRQSSNIGVEDLGRLVAAAENLSAQHRAEGIAVADIMSRDLVTVAPDTTLDEVTRLFDLHGFTSLPVTADGTYYGLVLQLDALRAGPAGRSAARDMIAVDLPHVTPGVSAAALLPLLSSGGCVAVPVLDRGQLVGIVTQTDLIAVLAKDMI